MLCSNCGKETHQDKCCNCSTVLHNTPMNNYINNVKKETFPIGWCIVSVICLLFAFFLFPPIVGGFGIYAGYKVSKNKKIPGVILIILNIISMVVGMWLVTMYMLLLSYI